MPLEAESELEPSDDDEVVEDEVYSQMTEPFVESDVDPDGDRVVVTECVCVKCIRELGRNYRLPPSVELVRELARTYRMAPAPTDDRLAPVGYSL